MVQEVYIPPAWTGVWRNPDQTSPLRATGFDVKGRKQYAYSAEWKEQAKSDKFARVRQMLSEQDDIRATIEADLNRKSVVGKDREAVLVAYLTFLTGIRPGSTSDTLADVDAYGATTLQLRHVKPCGRGVRLKFTGKKGVAQNLLVTDPYLVRVFLARKAATTKWTTTLFRVSASKVNGYIATLGSGEYTAKDFRTLRGTSLALELLGGRKRLPKALAARKRLVNGALDKVAKALGNTRAVARNAYVCPLIVEAILARKTLFGE